MYLESARSATQSDSPQYFIYLKNGALRPIKVPPGEKQFAVWRYGRWCPVFSRMETDAGFFAAHPEVPFRLKLHRSRYFRPDYFTFEITTRDSEVWADGDVHDFREYDAKRYGTPLEFLKSECERMLADPNRCSDSERWLATQPH